MKKKQLTFIFAFSVLLTSILVSNVSNAILASDQLEVGVNSFVEGKLLLETSVAGDELMAYVSIAVTKIFTPTDITKKIIQFEVKLQPVVGYESNLLENPTEFIATHLVFFDNRSTIMLGEFVVTNATEQIEMTVLHETKFADMTNPDNRKITFANGTSALAGSLEHADPKYIMLEEFSDMSDFYLLIYKYTMLAISPTAILGDDISYDPNLGLVIGTPAVTTSEGDSYDAILVEYTDTLLFNSWTAAYEVHAYYEAATGLLIQLYERLDQGTWKFIPSKVDTVIAAPFPSATVILSIAAIGLITVYFKKKK